MKARKYHYKKVMYTTSRRVRIAVGIILGCVFLAVVGLYIRSERNVRVLQQQMEQLQQSITELSEENRQLQEALEAVSKEP